MSTAWGVCHTHPNAERWAEANLVRQGYDVWLPLRVVLRRDRAVPTLTRRIPVPLFSGYLFVAVGTHWSPIRHTRGVNRLLMAGDKPYILPAAVQEAVQAGEALAGIETPPDALYRPGAPCSVSHGPMAGLPAVVVSVSRLKARIAMLFLSEMRVFNVPIDYLMARDV